MPRLIVVHKQREEAIDLLEGITLIGRSKECQVQISDAGASRVHCQITIDADGARVIDKGSRNGTVVNGKNLEPEGAPIRAGDCIRIGDTFLYYEKRTQTRRSDSAPIHPRILISDFLFAGVSPRQKFAKLLGLAVVIVVIAAVGAAGYFVVGTFSKPAGTGSPDNAIKNPSFEAPGLPWQASANVGLAIERVRASSGEHALGIEKKAQGVCGFATYEEKFQPGSGELLECSCQVRFQEFTGAVFLAVQWLNSEGTPVLEDCSDALESAKDWTKLERRFAPPPSAAACVVSVGVLGRSGKIFIDDASVAARKDESKATKRSAGFSAVVSRCGSVLAMWEGIPVLQNVRGELRGSSDFSSCTWARDARSTLESGVWSQKGFATNPVTLKPVECNLIIGATASELKTVCALVSGDRDSLQSVDFVLPFPKAAQLIYNKSPADKIGFTYGDRKFEIEMPEPVDFSVVRREKEGATLRLNWPMETIRSNKYRLGFIIREILATRAIQLEALKKQAAEKKNREEYVDALSLIDRIFELSRDDPQARALRESILNEREKAWRRCEDKAMRAELLRDRKLGAETRDLISEFEIKFGETADTKRHRQDIQSLLTFDLSRHEQAKHLVARGREYMDAGNVPLSLLIFETVVRNYKDTPSYDEAQQLIAQLRGK